MPSVFIADLASLVSYTDTILSFASSSIVILKLEYQHQVHCVYRFEGRYWSHCSRMVDSSVTSSRLAESQTLPPHDTKPWIACSNGA
ncbi:hypothetical protein CEP52_017298 [Fusarium oligoseptatum]|uniref:Uncharacterized protein n=1 Tax=Fusarium oligoseptatum TaxID=2604345 RepID=A0A428RTR1_9HYPO|nr:hypothetical protein CEP52_017298 [Fusarium oligoseptatum]